MGIIGNLFVRADHRRRGIGSALLAGLVATADEREYVRLVVSPSTEAVDLFRRGGFVPPEAAGATHHLLVRRGAS